MLESGCLAYFDWTKIAVVVAPNSDNSLPNSGSDVQSMLVLLILSALAAIC
jgi:hypothetical protein